VGDPAKGPPWEGRKFRKPDPLTDFRGHVDFLDYSMRGKLAEKRDAALDRHGNKLFGLGGFNPAREERKRLIAAALALAAPLSSEEEVALVRTNYSTYVHIW